MAGQDVQKTLLDLERKGWDSLCDSTGDVFYGQVMTDDAVMALAEGDARRLGAGRRQLPQSWGP